MKRNKNPKGTRGFTLVELLVVMAIIAILASIVVPNVARYITRSRMNKALVEVKNAQTSFTGMLSDAQVSNYRQFFDPTSQAWLRITQQYLPFERFEAAQAMYTDAFYDLCQNGKNANANAYGLRSEVVRKLGSNYMELPRDPWGQLYNIYAGPWVPPVLPAEGTGIWTPPAPPNEAFKYTPFRIRYLDNTVPGGPIHAYEIQGDEDPFCGPKDLPIYIWSSGQDMLTGQRIFGYGSSSVSNDGYPAALEEEQKGGGDDITNWDSGQTWQEFYG